jgi:hypothetical protein
MTKELQCCQSHDHEAFMADEWMYMAHKTYYTVLLNTSYNYKLSIIWCPQICQILVTFNNWLINVMTTKLYTTICNTENAKFHHNSFNHISVYLHTPDT